MCPGVALRSDVYPLPVKYVLACVYICANMSNICIHLYMHRQCSERLHLQVGRQAGSSTSAPATVLAELLHTHI